MFFGKKSKKQSKCEYCNTKISNSYSFCPYCGESIDEQITEKEDNYGLLGKNDHIDNQFDNSLSQGFTITDKLIGSLMNSLMKNLDKQFKNINNDFNNQNKPEIKTLPNGIRIRIGPTSQQKRKPQNKIHKNQITKEQIQRMSSLPRSEAKTKVTRLNNKIVYELLASGVENPDDVFISKLESGYEIKAISEKKVFVNTLPVNLPIRSFSIHPKKICFEFLTDHQFQ